jgi:hypothetical protein
MLNNFLFSFSLNFHIILGKVSRYLGNFSFIWEIFLFVWERFYFVWDGFYFFEDDLLFFGEIYRNPPYNVPGKKTLKKRVFMRFFRDCTGYIIRWIPVFGNFF